MSCAACDKPMKRTRNSAPQGRACCRPCRRLARGVAPDAPAKEQARTCAFCQSPFYSKEMPAKFCSRACSSRWGAKARTFHPEGSKSRHAQRHRSAPGLSCSQQKALLVRWQRQARTCSYCSNQATTIDHVIPLIRGGTNFEGNLAPACRSCNSSKNQWLLTEWRTGRRCAPAVYVLPTPPRIKKPKPTPEPRPLRPCRICSVVFQPASAAVRTCSPACSYEYTKRHVRESYRAKVGLPPTWDVPTKPQLRTLEVA